MKNLEQDRLELLTWIEEIRGKLQDRRAGLIAKATGLNAIWIGRFRDGKIREPGHAALARLSAYFEAQQ
jgi:hypothetical protein